MGDPAAQTTVRVYEDPLCPVVAEFELTGGASVLRDRTVGRQVKTEYTFASFRDERVGGDGSKRAVNALRAALDAGKFAEYHAVLFQHQPEAEVSGGYTTDYLLKLAGDVKGLRSKEFDHAVTTMKYRRSSQPPRRHTTLPMVMNPSARAPRQSRSTANRSLKIPTESFSTNFCSKPC
ncbi:DsbA family protein [Streptomyces xantholiticus]